MASAAGPRTASSCSVGQDPGEVRLFWHVPRALERLTAPALAGDVFSALIAGAILRGATTPDAERPRNPVRSRRRSGRERRRAGPVVDAPAPTRAPRGLGPAAGLRRGAAFPARGGCAGG